MEYIYNNKINKFCIILVIASPSIRCNLLKSILIKYMNSNKNFRTYFIYGDIDRNSIINSEYDLFLDCEECFVPGIFLKTIKALEYIDNRYNYEYVIRTNLSTFWRLDKLYDFLKGINIPYFCGGYLDSWRKNIHITGTGIILTRFPILYLINNYDPEEITTYNDDIIITKMLSRKFKIYNCLKRNHDFFKKNNKKVYFKRIKDKIHANFNINDFYFRLKSKNDFIKMNEFYKIYY